MPTVREIFGEDGLFAREVPGFVHRPGQLRMAEAVAALLEKNIGETADDAPCACLAVEAETGLGKTLAYLVPAVLSGRKVVVSTNTKNLQDQILHREIPLIRQYLAPKLKAVCVKGRQNYLCLYRWRQLLASREDGLFADPAEENIGAWLKTTRHGDRAELKWLSGSSPLWQAVCCRNEFCLGQDCPEASACLLAQLRRDAAAADLLVVNHHLLFSDLAVRRGGFGEVLPRYEAALFDEAHHLENVATTFFGRSFSKLQCLDLAADLEREAQTGLSGKARETALAFATELSAAAERFAAAFPQKRGRFPLDRTAPELTGEGGAAGRMADVLEVGAGKLEELGKRFGALWEQYGARATELADRLRRILAAEPEEDMGAEEAAEAADAFTRWYERSERNLSVSATPVEVAGELQGSLYATAKRCLFTSATLTTGGDFAYFYERMGLPEGTPSLFLPSPFDYAGRTRIYVPERGFPAPNEPNYQKKLHERIEALVGLAGGRALVLFTSRQAMEAAHAALAARLPFPAFMQGEASRHTLLERFSGEINSVLFAVASFWEGVDVPGESLSLVVMDKLPFEVPTDPVVQARMRRIEERGGSPFFELQIPRAVFTLRQGAGRLMRAAEDRGVIAVLDARLTAKRYGRIFLESLPPGPLTQDLADVAAFFAEENPS